MDSDDTPPVVDCPVLLKRLVYFNFVLLFFVGFYVLGNIEDIEDIQWVLPLACSYPLIFQFILAIGVRYDQPTRKLRAFARLLAIALLIILGPMGAAMVGGFVCDWIAIDPEIGVLTGLCGAYLGLSVYFISRPKNRGCRTRLLTHGLLIYGGPFVAGLIGGLICGYGMGSNKAIAWGVFILCFAYALPVNLVAALTQFGWKEKQSTFHRVAVRLSWCGVGLVGLAVIGVLGYYLVGGWMGARTWAKHKAAGEADGWKYRMEDYIGEIPADDDNFFKARPFNALLHTHEPDKELVYKNPKAQEELNALMDRAPSKVFQTVHRVSSYSVQRDWVAFAQKLRDEKEEKYTQVRCRFIPEAPPKGLSGDELVQLYFNQFDGLIDDLTEAAKRPKQYFPIAYENGNNTILPHLRYLKGMVQLLRESALHKMHRADTEGAMADIRLQFRLFEASGSGLYTISNLVHIAIGAIIKDTINKMPALWFVKRFTASGT